MALKIKLSKNRRKFLDSFSLEYKVVNKVSNHLLDKGDEQHSSPPWKTTSLKRFIKMIKENSTGKANYVVELFYIKDKDKFTSSLIRHYGKVNIEFRIRKVLDDWGMISFLDIYLKSKHFKVGSYSEDESTSNNQNKGE